MGIQIDACFDSSADDEDKVKELLGIRVYDKKMLSGYKGVVILSAPFFLKIQLYYNLLNRSGVSKHNQHVL